MQRGKSRKRLRKKIGEHERSWTCAFQAVPNSVQSALKDKSHNRQSFSSIYFLFISMVTLIVLSQPYRKVFNFSLAKNK